MTKCRIASCMSRGSPITNWCIFFGMSATSHAHGSLSYFCIRLLYKRLILCNTGACQQHCNCSIGSTECCEKNLVYPAEHRICVCRMILWTVPCQDWWLIADSITQPLLMRLQSNFYVKADNTGILVADCSSFTDLRLSKEWAVQRSTGGSHGICFT